MDGFNLKLITTAMGTTVVYMIGGFDLALQILLIAIVIDYLTGMMKGSKTTGLSSSVGALRLYKKAAIFLVVILAYQMDKISGLGTPAFRTATVVFYIANEGISIAENLTVLGVPLPPILVKTLKVWKEVSNKGDGVLKPKAEEE